MFNLCFFFSAEGFESTAKQNFGGGNTAWEERKLSKYETRWECSARSVQTTGHPDSHNLQAYVCLALSSKVSQLSRVKQLLRWISVCVWTLPFVPVAALQFFFSCIWTGCSFVAASVFFCCRVSCTHAQSHTPFNMFVSAPCVLHPQWDPADGDRGGLVWK